eukprot:maker-scaffold_12-snap-gene-4.45-mRNA-1 protein AED:0.02 eAED:0.02 QI:88/0.75/0.8/1/0.75/0.6/5/549/329
MKKKKESKRMTSLDVFHSFVIRQPNGELTQENIVSKPCFVLWLQSRSSRPKHPAGAFRRTIHAHLRAADGRNPFDKDVEESLLRKLRSIGKEKPEDPFAVIFGKGKRFRKSSSGGWYNDFVYPYGYHERRKNEKNKKTTAKSHRPTTSCSKLESKENIIKRLLHVSKDEMDIYRNQAKKMSLHFSFPAVAYLVDLLSTRTHFFSPDFILPAPDEQHFKKDCIPIWYAIMGVGTEDILHMDDNFRNFFASLAHLMQIVPSIVQFFIERRVVLPKLKSKGSVWFRGTHLVENKRFMYRAYTRILSGERQEVYYQLQTDVIVEDELLNKLML